MAKYQLALDAREIKHFLDARAKGITLSSPDNRINHTLFDYMMKLIETTEPEMPQKLGWSGATFCYVIYSSSEQG